MEKSATHLNFISHRGEKVVYYEIINASGRLKFSRPLNPEKVDYSKLSFLADIMVLHEETSKNGYPKIQAGEVVSQIPNEILSNAFAFELVFASNDRTINFFPEQKLLGGSVTVIRTYKLRDDMSRPAVILTKYPEEEADIPINMSASEFSQIKEYMKTNRF